MIPLISILIPAYQAEKTIERCLSSILNQTNNDFEVIVLDDGSADQTYSICEKYKNDERLVLYTQANAGVAETRQRLLDLAIGKYIQFVDADDWVEIDMVEKLKSILETEDYDLIISDYIYHKSNSFKYIQQKPSSLDSKSLIRDISSPKLLGVLWNKLIKRDLLYKVRIPKLHYCEDWCVCASVFEYANKIIYINTAFYHYDNTDTVNSLTRNISKETFKNRMQYIDYLQSIKFDKAYPKEFTSQVANIAYVALVNNIYSRKEFYSKFHNISFWNNYNSLYLRMILSFTIVFPLQFVRSIDNVIRKIFFTSKKNHTMKNK